jgi:hypothetical protein
MYLYLHRIGSKCPSASLRALAGSLARWALVPWPLAACCGPLAGWLLFEMLLAKKPRNMP